MHQHNEIGHGVLGRAWGGSITVVATTLLVAACAGRATTRARVPADGPGPTVSRAVGSPRWETVTTLTGRGPAEPPAFAISRDSLQWRVRWTCHVGHLRITTDPPPRRPAPLVDADCPQVGEGVAIVTGEVRIKIETSGPWQVTVDQQLDTPLREPPLEGMASAAAVRAGSFYPVEKDAKGMARISTRADGANVLRLESLEVSTNVDLFVWLSEASGPKTSAEAVAAPHVVLGNLKSTLGDQNYVLPADLPLTRINSIVIWCEPIRIAYGAAGLTA